MATPRGGLCQGVDCGGDNEDEEEWNTLLECLKHARTYLTTRARLLVKLVNLTYVDVMSRYILKKSNKYRTLNEFL